MDFVTVISLLLAGVTCGIVNVIGGGGSLLALPVLLALGLPAGVANGTNRIAILLQDITAVGTFRKQKQLPVREGLLLSIPIVIGALLGGMDGCGIFDRNDNECRYFVIDGINDCSSFFSTG